MDALRVIVGLEQLQACRERKFFKNVNEAPAGQLNESKDVRCKPVGAVQFPDPDPSLVSDAGDEAL